VPKPTFSHMEIPEPLYDAVCERIDQAFADSYLTGAKFVGRTLTPRTLTAYGKMRDSVTFRKFLAEFSIELVRPLPFHQQEHPISHKEIYRMVH
jgi:hypothetical protein